ncbi:MAG: PKD domain protein [Candidatus Bathyarchaeota archaeon BA2]|nr:MAG: PKD domain protein [Candidatus Bathyarchaeota archaeon BA2]
MGYKEYLVGLWTWRYVFYPRIIWITFVPRQVCFEWIGKIMPVPLSPEANSTSVWWDSDIKCLRTRDTEGRLCVRLVASEWAEWWYGQVVTIESGSSEYMPPNMWHYHEQRSGEVTFLWRAMITNRAPVADGISVTEAHSTKVWFSGLAHDDDGDSLEYYWDFGDGNTATGKIAYHAYTSKGIFTATLTVTDDDGATSTDTVTITVIIALSGVVTDEYYNQPLQGVTITLSDGSTTTTDANGYYEFTPLTPGDYWVAMTLPTNYNTIDALNKTLTITSGQETHVNFNAYPLPVISIIKSTINLEAEAGDTVTYLVYYENLGPGPAENVTLIDILPEMVSFVSSYPEAIVDGQTLTWMIGELLPGRSGTIDLTVRISLLAYPDTILTNTVTIAFNDWHGFEQTPICDSATTTVVSTTPTQDVRGVGYWKHQINAILAGKSSQVTESQMLLYIEMIRMSSQVFADIDTLEEVAQILRTPTGKDSMETRARQQLYALWLNLAAKAFAANTSIDLHDLTAAGTIGEAITQCETILLDPTSTKESYELAKDICDQLNNGNGIVW